MSPMPAWKIVGLCSILFAGVITYAFDAFAELSLLLVLIMGWGLIQMKKSKAKKHHSNEKLY
jgi:hypothetical protein